VALIIIKGKGKGRERKGKGQGKRRERGKGIGKKEMEKDRLPKTSKLLNRPRRIVHTVQRLSQAM
jgi:hypothetical protein